MTHHYNPYYLKVIQPLLSFNSIGISSLLALYAAFTGVAACLERLPAFEIALFHESSLLYP
jgi:hypothetical protein